MYIPPSWLLYTKKVTKKIEKNTEKVFTNYLDGIIIITYPMENNKEGKEMTKEMWIEENREAMENAYYKLYMLYVSGDATLEEVQTFENALVSLGILETDGEMEEAQDGFDWEAWALDAAIDAAMDYSLVAAEREKILP
jgi:hypothetical protein